MGCSMLFLACVMLAGILLLPTLIRHPWIFWCGIGAWVGNRLFESYRQGKAQAENEAKWKRALRSFEEEQRRLSRSGGRFDSDYDQRE